MFNVKIKVGVLFLFMRSSQILFVFMYCIQQYVIMGKKQLTDDANYPWSASEFTHVPMWAPCKYFYICCCFHSLTKQVIFNHLWLLLKNQSWLTIELCPFSTGVCDFFSWHCKPSKQICLGNLQKQTHPSDKHAASSIRLCLWNTFPFCHYVPIIAVSLYLHTLLVTVRLK